MRIAELSPDFRTTTTSSSSAGAGAASNPQSHPHHTHLLSDLESAVKSLESLSPSPEPLPQTLTLSLRTTFSLLSSSFSSNPLSDAAKLQIWKLSYRLWNVCVDLANALQNDEARHRDRDRDLADLRQISADLLILAGNPSGIPNPELKSASFFYKTGLIWHDLRKFDLASNCFDKATSLAASVKIDQIRDEEEKRLLLDLNLARSRTAWEVSDRNLAIALLNRSKNLIFGSPAACKSLAEQFLQFGKLGISQNCSDASKLLAEALDLCEKGILASKALALTLDLQALKARCLRFLAAERLQNEDFEGVLKCVGVLRAANKEGKEHPSIGYIKLKAWLGLGRVLEAEKELKGIMDDRDVPENVIVSAAELYLSAAGIEAAMSVLISLLGRCRAGAGAALRVVRRVADGGGGGRAKVVAELAADERVVAVFEGEGAAKERSAMHAILWNW